MKKVTIEYDCSESDYELRLSLAAQGLSSCLSDIDNTLRSLVKYGNEPLSDNVSQTISDIRRMIGEELARFNLNEE